ncbi:MAG: PAS domain-containing protein, partial [Desulfobacteraceae bacterium]|nr:PAS domain-containing protein [Desulfobacteraceae bacterium]
MDNIDLIVELTGDLNIYNDILAKKNQRVRAIAHTTALLFWEIDSAARMYSKTNQELCETQALYDVLINGLILEDVVVIALDHKILDINDTFLKKLGLTKEEAIGHCCYEITHRQSIPCSGKEHPCPLADVIETGKSSRATHIHLGQSGNKHYVSISCYPLFEMGKLKGVVEVSKDITKEIEFEKKMMQQEKLVSIGRLSAGVAHEINNPLTTILTSSMLIQEDLEEGTEIHKELTIISNEALRCRKIVKSLLDFARQSKPFKKMDDLNQVIKESLVLTRKQAKFKNIDLSSNLADRLPPFPIDRDQIQQTIINLTLNAIEATPSGGEIWLSSQYFENKNAIEIQVSDTGDGILVENLDKIFDPFFTTKKNGTGLG